MNRRVFAVPFAALIASSLAVACVAGTDETEEDGTSDESELRQFKAGELLGTIAYGETKTVVHGGKPLYRAYAFTVAAGDSFTLTANAGSADAVIWLLNGTTNATIKRSDAFRAGLGERLDYTSRTGGKYMFVFREAASRSATFNVSLQRQAADGGAADSGATDGGAADSGDESNIPGVPACTGIGRAPVTGPVYLSSVVSYPVTRQCDAFGVCSAWAFTGRSTPVRGSVKVSPNAPFAYVSAELNLSSYSSQQGSSTYNCNVTDTGSGSLSSASEGTFNMRWLDRCNISGGSGGPYEYGPQRPSKITFGSSCLSIEDIGPTPATNFGTQRRTIYIAR